MPIKNNRPRHEQIARWIREKIQAAEFLADEKLPSESELSKQFKVSRVTVRRALQTLEGEHLIYRSQGLGSFVRGKKAMPDPLQLMDFMEEMRQSGLQATSRVLKSEVVPAPPQVASRLSLPGSTKVFRLDRLRLAEGKPIAFDYTWLPAFYGQLVVDCDLENRTIFNILEGEYGIEITSGCYYMQAENADKYLSNHLEVGLGAALFRMDRISYTLEDKPVYFQQRYYRNDRIMYRMKVLRSKESSGTGRLPLSEISAEFQDGE